MALLESLIASYGYLALFIGTFLEGETILVLAGIAAHAGYLELPWVILTAFVGSLSGDQLCFFLGRRYGKAWLAKSPLWQARAERAHKLTERHHDWIILTFRFFYGLRNVIPFSLGMSRVSVPRFVLLNAIGAFVWAIVLGTGGYLLGAAAETVLSDVKHYQILALVIVALVALAFWIVYRVRQRCKLVPRKQES